MMILHVSSVLVAFILINITFELKGNEISQDEFVGPAIGDVPGQPIFDGFKWNNDQSELRISYPPRNRSPPILPRADGTFSGFRASAAFESLGEVGGSQVSQNFGRPEMVPRIPATISELYLSKPLANATEVDFVSQQVQRHHVPAPHQVIVKSQGAVEQISSEEPSPLMQLLVKQKSHFPKAGTVHVVDSSANSATAPLIMELQQRKKQNPTMESKLINGSQEVILQPRDPEAVEFSDFEGKIDPDDVVVHMLEFQPEPTQPELTKIQSRQEGNENKQSNEAESNDKNDQTHKQSRGEQDKLPENLFNNFVPVSPALFGQSNNVRKQVIEFGPTRIINFWGPDETLTSDEQHTSAKEVRLFTTDRLKSQELVSQNVFGTLWSPAYSQPILLHRNWNVPSVQNPNIFQGQTQVGNKHQTPTISNTPISQSQTPAQFRRVGSIGATPEQPTSHFTGNGRDFLSNQPLDLSSDQQQTQRFTPHEVKGDSLMFQQNLGHNSRFSSKPSQWVPVSAPMPPQSRQQTRTALVIVESRGNEHSSENAASGLEQKNVEQWSQPEHGEQVIPWPHITTHSQPSIPNGFTEQLISSPREISANSLLAENGGAQSQILLQPEQLDRKTEFPSHSETNAQQPQNFPGSHSLEVESSNNQFNSKQTGSKDVGPEQTNWTSVPVVASDMNRTKQIQDILRELEALRKMGFAIEPQFPISEEENQEIIQTAVHTNEGARSSILENSQEAIKAVKTPQRNQTDKEILIRETKPKMQLFVLSHLEPNLETNLEPDDKNLLIVPKPTIGNDTLGASKRVEQPQIFELSSIVNHSEKLEQLRGHDVPETSVNTPNSQHKETSTQGISEQGKKNPNSMVVVLKTGEIFSEGSTVEVHNSLSVGECKFSPTCWTSKPNTAIINTNRFSRLDVSSCAECLEACTRTSICQSVTYDHNWNVCDLYDVSGSQTVSPFAGRDYFKPTGICNGHSPAAHTVEKSRITIDQPQNLFFQNFDKQQISGSFDQHSKSRRDADTTKGSRLFGPQLSLAQLLSQIEPIQLLPTRVVTRNVSGSQQKPPRSLQRQPKTVQNFSQPKLQEEVISRPSVQPEEAFSPLELRSHMIRDLTPQDLLPAYPEPAHPGPAYQFEENSPVSLPPVNDAIPGLDPVFGIPDSALVTEKPFSSRPANQFEENNPVSLPPVNAAITGREPEFGVPHSALATEKPFSSRIEVPFSSPSIERRFVDHNGNPDALSDSLTSFKYPAVDNDFTPSSLILMNTHTLAVAQNLRVGECKAIRGDDGTRKCPHGIAKEPRGGFRYCSWPADCDRNMPLPIWVASLKPVS